jgi:hypothetical protein
MRKLLREYWVWIVAPIFVLIAVLAAFVVLFGADEAAPFVYATR